MPLWGKQHQRQMGETMTPTQRRDLRAALKSESEEFDAEIIGDRQALADLKEQYVANVQDLKERIATDKARKAEIKTMLVELKAE